MKILQVARQFHPSVGGIESVVAGLSAALRRAGHCSDVVTLRRIFSTGEQAPAQEAVDGVRVYRLPHWGIRRYPIAPGVLRLVSGYDVIHVHGIDFFVDFLSLTRPFHRRPLVVNTHGGIFHTRWLWPFKRAYFQTITRLSLAAARAVICDSPTDRDLFRAIVPSTRLHVIPNGVNVEPFLGIEKRIQPGLLVGIGRVAENKGLEALLDLLPELTQLCGDVQLAWIGEDAEGRVPGLRARADRLGVGARVRFLGRLPLADVQHWLAQAHLFVSLARYEAFGVAAIEAMSSGTVPVVTPVGIYPTAVRDGETGFLCPPDRAGMLPRFRQAFSLDARALGEMGRRARQAAAGFSWDSTVAGYLQIYRAAAGGIGHDA